MVFNSYLRITLCFVIFIILARGNLGNSNSVRKTETIAVDLDDYLKANDLLKYLRSLRVIIAFGHKHKSEIDVNFAFGLSIVNDNCKYILMRRKNGLPEEVNTYVKDILSYNNELLQYFQAIVKLSENKNNATKSKISSLFINSTLGVSGIFEFFQEKISSTYFSISSYLDWDTYMKKVNQYEKWKPSPKEADKCLASLAKNHWNKQVCNLSSACYTILVNGTNFGYALTHRLLILIQAYRGRGCRIFSLREDLELMHKFCLKIYHEANFIAANNYGLLDLMLEEMALCSLAGYPDILRRSWFEEALRHQTASGCFAIRLPVTNFMLNNVTYRPWKTSSTVQTEPEVCDRHLTAVAAGALSAGLRYIIEKTYGINNEENLLEKF